MRKLFIVLLCLFVSNANALDFHFGNRAVPLTTVKHTTPSLNIMNEFGEIFYGALLKASDYTVPANVVHIRDYDGVEYFLSPWCDAGYYPSSDTNECIPCGYGHFCAGGNHRESCTYGIIACNTTTSSFDPPMPAGTENMYNRALTMDEINQYVPVTGISDWKKIFKNGMNQMKTCASGENYPDNPDLNMFDTVIGPGTYITILAYPWPGMTGSFGDADTAETAYMLVFDHPVVYRPVHVCNHFANYFDTKHVPYEKYDLVYPEHQYFNESLINVTNIGSTFSGYLILGLFELK